MALATSRRRQYCCENILDAAHCSHTVCVEELAVALQQWYREAGVSRSVKKVEGEVHVHFC